MSFLKADTFSRIVICLVLSRTFWGFESSWEEQFVQNERQTK